jgi:hypothetical protein
VILALTFTPFLQSKEPSFIDLNKKKIITYLSSETVLPQLTSRIGTFHDETELLNFVKQITPALEKLCQASDN